MRVKPVILSGGAGTRLWPLSRRAYPKQFLRLFAGHSLFELTCERVSQGLFSEPIVLGNHEHRFLIGEQLEGSSAARIVLEPVARNTAPAVAIAALLAAEDGPTDPVLVLPSDHLIDDPTLFAGAIQSGARACHDGALVTFGVRPSRPHTGYGYIETAPSDDTLARPVKRFVEKPDLATAERYVSDGNFYWNAGIFLFRPDAMLAAFEEHAPGILGVARDALAGAQTDLDFLRLDETAYAQAEAISLDYAIMEKVSNIRCVPLSTSWSDLGSWPSVWEAMDKDEDGNAAEGDGASLFHGAQDCFSYSDKARLALVGVSDLMVVATEDCVLVASKDHAEEVKGVVAQVKAEGGPEVDLHTRVYRPWGWYQGLGDGERFQVKCIMVKPGAQLSLQSHYHRAEHWVVVRGTVDVTIGDQVRTLTENQSTYIPLGEVHRLANPGRLPAFLIEVQSGPYLGEDDIVRYEDDYGRNV